MSAGAGRPFAALAAGAVLGAVLLGFAPVAPQRSGHAWLATPTAPATPATATSHPPPLTQRRSDSSVSRPLAYRHVSARLTNPPSLSVPATVTTGRLWPALAGWLAGAAILFAGIVASRRRRYTLLPFTGANEEKPRNESARPVVVVTGSNRGIGFHIARLLGEAGWHVVLACRDTKRMEKAMKRLSTDIPDTRISGVQLDLDDLQSIEVAARIVQTKCGSIDALVNNAAMAFKFAATEPFGLQARVTVQTNFVGTLKVCEAFLPVLRPGGRIVNVSSRAGNVDALAPHLRRQFQAPNLTLDGLSALMEAFVAAAEAGTHRQQGWTATAYATSKIGVTVATRLLARDYPEVSVDACCPGWCATDMAGDDAPKQAEEGADTPFWLVTRPSVERRGLFYAERREVR